MDNNTQMIKTQLADGSVIYVQATMLGGRQDIALSLPPFGDIMRTISSIAESIVLVLRHIKPQKASVEFGLEFALASGKLTSMLVQGTNNANLKITLEWSEERP
jgi:hypothetical protein